jgi:hypothetical protein
VALERRDAAALTELATRERLEKEERQRQEWRWLGLATLGGTLLGGLISWAVAYATSGDDSGVLFTRGGWAVFAAIVGAGVGLTVGFLLWALWILLRTLRWRFSQRR